MAHDVEEYLYSRSGRFWADLRDFEDVGGKREALKLPGTGMATKDRETALVLLAKRVEDLEGARRAKLMGHTHGIAPAMLKPYLAHHLKRKAQAGKVTEKTISTAQHHLERATSFFGADAYLHTIAVADVTRWAEHLSTVSNGRGGTLSGATVRHHLNDLSNLYRRAQAEGRVRPGYNPVAAMMDKPSAKRREAEWLEVPDAALLLEASKHVSRERDWQSIPFLHALVATFLLTGGRKSEVLGLGVEDVSFDRKTVTFRPNEWRRLKTSTSHRTVPLWPQLEEILREHVFGAGRVQGLLFPSPVPESRRKKKDSSPMLYTVWRALDAIAEKAEWKEGKIRTKIFRHTYCAARLQTLDRGAPISPWTVAREMGHGGRSLVDRVYGHLGEIRHRSEVVEYRVDQHQEELGERLTALRAGA